MSRTVLHSRVISRSVSDVLCVILHLQNRANTSPSHTGDNEMKDAQRLSILHKNMTSLIPYKLAATLKFQRQFNSRF